MHSSSPATVNKILAYTAVAANALEDIAAATHIPFLSRVCTLALTIIPMVQVYNREKYLVFVVFIQNAEY